MPSSLAASGAPGAKAILTEVEAQIQGERDLLRTFQPSALRGDT
jgi:hypothetical protein